MPSSRVLIASNTLTSSAASVTFSSIPGTYTDLVLRWSARSTGNTHRGDIRFNSDSSSNYSDIYIDAIGSTVSSSLDSNITSFYGYAALNNSFYTASTFSNGELYIPSYTSSANKPLSYYSVVENNSSTANRIEIQSGLWRNSSSITSITFTGFANNIDSGSSFFLYGLSNT